MSSTLFPNNSNQQDLQKAMKQAQKMASNPNILQQVLQMVGSGSPKDLFYAKCKEMGIKPNTILSMLNMK